MISIANDVTSPYYKDITYVSTPDTSWACASGITTYISLKVLKDNHDFCVLVQRVSRLLYHPYKDVLNYWDPDARDLIRHKRELKITLTIILGLSLGAAATGTSAIALQH